MSQQLGGQPILILKEGTNRTRGRDAQGMNITAAMAVASAVRTTLGPKGMDKMLVDTIGDVVITNDGVTILKEMDIEHPAAKMMVEVAKTQDDEVGDGTTTAVVIARGTFKEGRVTSRTGRPPDDYRRTATEGSREGAGAPQGHRVRCQINRQGAASRRLPRPR